MKTSVKRIPRKAKKRVKYICDFINDNMIDVNIPIYPTPKKFGYHKFFESYAPFTKYYRFFIKRRTDILFVSFFDFESGITIIFNMDCTITLSSKINRFHRFLFP